MLAWHFLPDDKRLGYDDGRAVEVGQTLECEGTPELCRNGMHGSVRLIDALKYASGYVICRVKIEDDIVEGDDKLCGRRRTVLWMLDATHATRILNEFACECAEDALALIAEPDPRSVAAIAAKRRWLNGEITDDELEVARAAAWAAARSARAAARSAAWAAAWSAAWAAVRPALDAADAASIAARDAWEAASHAARAAAKEKQDARLTAMVMTAREIVVPFMANK